MLIIMRAKFLKTVFYTLGCISFFFTSCNDEGNEYPDLDGQSPNIELTSNHIHTLTGYEFSLKGKIVDKDGIQSIHILCSDLYLDKTIDLLQLYSECQYEYNLDYAFTIPEEIEGTSFTIKIIVTDVGGRVTEDSILVTMDGDYTLPELEIKSSTTINVVVSEGTEHTVQFQATDNKGLAYVEVSAPELDLIDQVQVSTQVDTLTSFDYEKNLSFPTDKLGSFKMYMRAVDLLGNVAIDSCNVLISLVKDYTSMYFVDFEGNDPSLLIQDQFGIPFSAKHIDNFQYEAHCYSKGGTPVRFIVNEDNFDICFGADKNNNGKLTSIVENLQPIVLPEEGYYKIMINTLEETYSVEREIPEDTPLPIGQKVTAYNPGDGGSQEYIYQFGLAGNGFEGAFGFTTDNVYEMTPDVHNPYQLSCELTFSEGGNDLDFTLTPNHPWGWWIEPSWRYDGRDNSFDPKGDNASRYIPGGTYIFIFDTHLGQGKLISKNK